MTISRRRILQGLALTPAAIALTQLPQPSPAGATLPVRSVGYVGGSITRLPVRGYHRVTSAQTMWPDITDYNNGSIYNWVYGGTKWFNAFDAMNATYPAERVWIKLDLRDAELPPTMAELWDLCRRLVIQVKERVPTATLYVSAMQRYAEGCGPNCLTTPPLMEKMAARIVGKGKALAGPVLPMLTPATLKADLMHQNDAGQIEAGRILHDFWSAL